MLDQAVFDKDKGLLDCKGFWDLAHLSSLEAPLNTISWPHSGTVKINGSNISTMDTAGAWLLYTLQEKLKQHGVTVQLEGFSPAQQTLLKLVETHPGKISELPKATIPNGMARFGKNILQMLSEFQEYLAFVGKLTFEMLRLITHPFRIRWSELASTIFKTGYQALPIIALLSFMVGVVITYQMGIQLRNYGANVFIVDLLGLAVLREFASLMTAIMVAGRTGSSFTAQLGIMKINQEIDALNTMGVTPGELLLLPRIIGLTIALPLLTMWSDIFGVLGGMVMANNMLGITWAEFLHRFQHTIPLRAFLIGIGKAPVFALIISSIGCFEGMRVEGSADSIGRNTTRSVVLSIFFIILADAAFSIIFSKLKL